MNEEIEKQENTRNSHTYVGNIAYLERSLSMSE